MKESGGTIKSEIQICLNGIYGYFLLKIEERPIQSEEKTMVEQFGDLSFITELQIP